MKEQLEAVCSRIRQLQAADVPSALQGLLQQAASLLKPPSRSAGAPAGPPPPSAASRQPLVLAIFTLLERATLLAPQQRGLIKDAQSQLLSAFQQHGWLWELLLRKHLDDLMQRPAAARMFVLAVAQLPDNAQAKVYRLWRQQLQQAKQPVPQTLQQALLEQLKVCFHAGSVELPFLPEDQAMAAGAELGEAAVTAVTDPMLQASTVPDVRVMLREQLPHLLHLLLAVACGTRSSSGCTIPVDAAAGLMPNSEHGSDNAAVAPSLGSMQSAAESAGRRLRHNCSSRVDDAGQGTVSAGASSPGSLPTQAAGKGVSSSSSSSYVLDSVLHHAVLLVSRLSDPDALHDMLSIQPHLHDTAGSGSEQQLGTTASAAAVQQQGWVLTTRQLARVQTCLALIEVCLDGMLTLSPLAVAVHRQLHSKGSSTGGNSAAREEQQQSASADSLHDAGAAGANPAAAEQKQAAAEAEGELQHTAGLMLGMHRELSRLCSEQQHQQGGAWGEANRSSRRLQQQAGLLSLPACMRLLHMLAIVSKQDGAPSTAAACPAAPGDGQQQQQLLSSDLAGSEPTKKQPTPRLQRAATLRGAAQAPPAYLLVPPQLAVQGLELVRGSLEACSSSAPQSGSCASWHAEMAEQVAAIYLACYQAMWGARVLQSAEAYQLLLSAARLRMLLRTGGGTLAGTTSAADDEAAAEAALLTQHTVGSRRRPRTGAFKLTGQRAAGAADGSCRAPAAKRLKQDPGSSGGDAVRELLQLFQAPAPGEQPSAAAPAAAHNSQDPQQQPEQQAGRKRITAVAVKPEPQQSEEQQQRRQAARERKRIVPEQLASGPVAAGAAPDGGGTGQQQQLLNLSEGGSGGPAVGAEGGNEGLEARKERAKQRVVISKAAEMTEEQQEEMWAAYIADKEFLAEMLGDADYQQWYDEEAHPLRKQQRRAGGLEAAWAAVLGGPTAGSLVQRELPRTLLEASGKMPWDAATAACLQLLRLLLGVAGPAPAAADSAAAGTQEEAAQRDSLLLRTFGQQLRKEGAVAAANALLGISGPGLVAAAMRAAQAAPAGGALVVLSAQLLGLVRGDPALGQSPLFGGMAGLQNDGRAEHQLLGRQWAGGSSRLTAPPLLEAYAQLLADLLEQAQQEAAASQASRGKSAAQQAVQPLHLSAALATRLMLLPPPVQHMLGPGCAKLLRLAAADCGGQQAVCQLSALLWMLAQGGSAGGASSCSAQLLRLPADCPAWLEDEALIIEGPPGDASSGHALLLGPLPEVRQAAAAELLAQLVRQLQCQQHQHVQSGSGAAEGRWQADELLPAADACHAAIQVLLAEQQHHQQQQAGDASESDSEEEGGAARPLLWGNAAATAHLASLATALCDAGAAAAGAVAALVDAVGAGDAQAGRQQQEQAELAEPSGAATAAARVLALCNQFLEPADSLLQSGCLAAGAAQQLEAACERLEGQLAAVEQLCMRLPQDHALLAEIEAAMDAAPTMWSPAGADEQTGNGGGSSSGSGEEAGRSESSSRGARKGRAAGGKVGGKGGSSQQQQPKRRKRRRLQDVRNPAVRAMLAEDGCTGELDADDLSDLEDFIVCNPERDYDSFFRQYFWQDVGSDSEEEAAEQGGRRGAPGSSGQQQQQQQRQQQQPGQSKQREQQQPGQSKQNQQQLPQPKQRSQASGGVNGRSSSGRGKAKGRLDS